MASKLLAHNKPTKFDRNTYVESQMVLGKDGLTHCSVGKKTSMLGDFVCVGGSLDTMKEFAAFMLKRLGLEEGGEDLKDHGPGSPSTSSVLMLHELIQLEHQAWCCEVTAIRIGTWRRIGPGRLDGTLWSSSREEKLQRLKRAYKASVRNTEMESTVFVAECRFCGLKDQLAPCIPMECQQRPQPLISNFIQQQLGFHGQISELCSPILT
ncbi:unnamed protein product [Nyctereutes procyonoides]|uniref:(raccoon dog) hypothetical protein n=1 Tax=Nyctereutes procyonoides TaxID=34880 RepID=A0A811ZNM7_NYCPR|nr:unnamed protein product [Nyctereutes procyonoides]